MIGPARHGDWVSVERVTGPSHTWLSLHLVDDPHGALDGWTPEIEVGPAPRECVHGPIDLDRVRANVLLGVADVNAGHGTTLAVEGIRVRDRDCGPEAIHGHLARVLARYVAEERGAAPLG